MSATTMMMRWAHRMPSRKPHEWKNMKTRAEPSNAAAVSEVSTALARGSESPINSSVPKKPPLNAPGGVVGIEKCCRTHLQRG